LGETITRFLVGGVLVSLFAFLGDLFKPKSFAGLFGAAPSVALAALVLTIAKDGAAAASTEGRSMLAGAVALFLYCLILVRVLTRRRWHALQSALAAMLVWFGAAFVLWSIFLR
jgi:Protein of unknown function (DUF3147)